MKNPDGKITTKYYITTRENPDGTLRHEYKTITYNEETGEIIETQTEQNAADGKWHYKFEWNDLRALITLLNVVLVMIYGLSIAWFGLAVALIGCIKDLTEIPDGKFRFSSLIMHLSSVALNVYFLVLCFMD